MNLITNSPRYLCISMVLTYCAPLALTRTQQTLWWLYWLGYTLSGLVTGLCVERTCLQTSFMVSIAIHLSANRQPVFGEMVKVICAERDNVYGG